MKKNVLDKTLIDLYAVVDFNVRVWGANYGTDEYWKKLERELNNEIREFNDFIRDHRSRDTYSISVERKYIYSCPHCNHEYPEDFNGIADCCGEILLDQGYEMDEDGNLMRIKNEAGNS